MAPMQLKQCSRRAIRSLPQTLLISPVRFSSRSGLGSLRFNTWHWTSRTDGRYRLVRYYGWNLTPEQSTTSSSSMTAPAQVGKLQGNNLWHVISPGADRDMKCFSSNLWTLSCSDFSEGVSVHLTHDVPQLPNLQDLGWTVSSSSSLTSIVTDG